MSNHPSEPIQSRADALASFKFLKAHQIAMIDEALASLGEFGEVRLVVEKGRLRFLITQQSFDALKWQPGSINEAVK